MTKNDSEELFKSGLEIANRKLQTSASVSAKNSLYSEKPKRKRIVNRAEGLLHQRMGHVQEDTVAKMIISKRHGMADNDKFIKKNCVTCQSTKQMKSYCDGKLIKNAMATAIHAKVYGPFRELSLGGNKYILAITTTSHRYVEIKAIADWSQVAQCILNYIAWIERNVEKRVKRVLMHNAKAFIALHNEIRQMEVNPTTTAAYSVQSNGLLKRMNRTLLDKVRALLKSANLKEAFWGKAMGHAAYLHN